jgi:hypothetical protein
LTHSQDPNSIQNEPREQTALPQLSSRVEESRNKNLIEGIDNPMSRTLYKVPGTGGNNNSEVFGTTSFGGLKYKNPFKTGRDTEKLVIPE